MIGTADEDNCLEKSILIVNIKMDSLWQIPYALTAEENKNKNELLRIRPEIKRHGDEAAFKTRGFVSTYITLNYVRIFRDDLLSDIMIAKTELLYLGELVVVLDAICPSLTEQTVC